MEQVEERRDSVSLVEDMARIAFTHNMTQSCLRDIAKMIREQFNRLDLPIDPRTYLNRYTNFKFQVEDKDLVYLGIRRALEDQLKLRGRAVELPETIELGLNFDGLPIASKIFIIIII